MSIRIEFTGETPLDVLAETAAFGLFYMSNQAVSEAAQRLFAESGKKEPPKEPYIEESPHEAPEPETKPAQKTEPAQKTGPAPKLEDVRAAGVEAARKYGQPKVKALLSQFNAPNITGVKEEDRAAFLAALKELGSTDAG